MWAGSRIVTDPLPSTSRMPFGLTSAAVSSSMPMPSSAGDWATSASSRPNRLRCSKCWSMSTPGQQPEAGAHLGHALLRRRAARAERDHVAGDRRGAGARAGDDRAVPVAIDDRLARAAVPPITLDRRSWLPPVMKIAVASSSMLDEAPIVRVVADERPHAAHVGDPHLAEEATGRARSPRRRATRPSR